MKPEQLQALDDDQLIQTYRRVREMMEADKEEFSKQQAPKTELKEALETEAKRRLSDRGSDSFKTPHGTCFQQMDTSVTVKDKAAFFDWLNDNDNWDYADIRAGKKAIQEYAEEKNGDLPPGINMSQRVVVRFRAPSNK